jgi:hypothetical protein
MSVGARSIPCLGLCATHHEHVCRGALETLSGTCPGKTARSSKIQRVTQKVITCMEHVLNRFCSATRAHPICAMWERSERTISVPWGSVLALTHIPDTSPLIRHFWASVSH